MVIVAKSIDSINKAIEAIADIPPSRAEQLAIRRKWRATLARRLKSEAIPAMREITPKRTGVAAKSLRVKTISNPYGLEIGPGRRGFYIQFHPDAEELAQRYHGIIQDVYDRHSGPALDDAIREVLDL